MKKKLLLIIVVCLTFGLALVMAASAQEPEGGGAVSVGAQDEVVGMSVVNSFGDDVLYMFSGVINNTALATSVHCTNHYTDTVNIEVRFFQSSGTGSALDEQTLASKETMTISTQNTFYTESVPSGSLTINQGVGVVRVTDPADVKDVICTAQVVGLGNNVETDPPTVLAKLDLFDREGNLVNPPDSKVPDSLSCPCFIYLPTVLKNPN